MGVIWNTCPYLSVMMIVPGQQAENPEAQSTLLLERTHAAQGIRLLVGICSHWAYLRHRIVYYALNIQVFEYMLEWGARIPLGTLVRKPGVNKAQGYFQPLSNLGNCLLVRLFKLTWGVEFK